MSKFKITVAKGDGQVRVVVESDRLPEENDRLSFMFTDEGLITDLINDEGEVVKTASVMYDDLAEDLQ